jgi:hypothetical protein
VGRPTLAPELVRLIERMSLENPLWSRRRIACDLAKLGHCVDKDTVAKYMPKPPWRPRRPPSQTWKTFLRNHLVGAIAIDLRQFGPRFVDNYARANRQKASTIASKESILKAHLYPRLSDKRLDAIGDEHVQALKSSLAKRSKKTVNNVLAVLGKLLRIAVKWKVIEKLPCTVELMKVSNLVVKFYEFGQYTRLVEAADRYAASCWSCSAATPAFAWARSSLCAGVTSTSDAGRSSFSNPSGKASWTFPRAAREGSFP